MLIVLIILNFILILTVIIVLYTKNNIKGTTIFTRMEDFELLEFQDNLKSLIEELNKVTSTSVKEMENKKAEIDKLFIEIDSKIKELKYMIERVNLLKKPIIRQDFQKKEENLLNIEQKKVNYKTEVKNENLIDTNINKTSKFVIDENSSLLNQNKLKYENIKKLLLQGMPINEIAKLSNLTIGEIELIKNLKI